MLDVKVRINARSLRSAGPEMALLPTADLQRFFSLACRSFVDRRHAQGVCTQYSIPPNIKMLPNVLPIAAQ
jgi:hypothetical protein